MIITLPPELEKYVDEKVRSGQFGSASDVMADALVRHKEMNEMSDAELAHLRAEIAIGIEQSDRGETAPWDLEDTKRRLNDRIAKRK